MYVAQLICLFCVGSSKKTEHTHTHRIKKRPVKYFNTNDVSILLRISSSKIKHHICDHVWRTHHISTSGLAVICRALTPDWNLLQQTYYLLNNTLITAKYTCCVFLSYLNFLTWLHSTFTDSSRNLNRMLRAVKDGDPLDVVTFFCHHLSVISELQV